MFNKNSPIVLLCTLLSLFSLSAEIIVVKKDASGTVIPLDTTDQENYVKRPTDPQDKPQGIFDLLTRYQWPTNLLFADSISEEERNEVFAATADAEAQFITKKLTENYQGRHYHAMFIPNTVYQLGLIAYYSQHLQEDDPLAEPLKNFAQSMSHYLESFFFKPNEEGTEGQLIDLPASLQEFYEACKTPFSNQYIAQISFIINNELGSKIKNKTELTADTWKIIAAEYIKIIMDNQEQFNLLPHPYEEFTNEDRFDYAGLAKELEGATLKASGIVSNLIDAEVTANQANQALLLNASKPFPLPLGIYTQEKAGIEILSGTLHFTTLTELDQANKINQIQPHATSYGLSAFNGAFYCKWDMPYSYASDQGDYFSPGAYFYALKINKNDYRNNRCGNLFIIPPFSPLVQVFGLDSMYHALTTVALKTIPDAMKAATGTDGITPEQRITIAGFEQVHDTAGILIIETDPINHAQRSSQFAADNAILLQAPANKSWEEGQQLLKNFALAANFYQTFAELSGAEKNISLSDVDKGRQALPKALHHHLALLKESQQFSSTPNQSSIAMIPLWVEWAKRVLHADISAPVFQRLATTIYNRYIAELNFVKTAFVNVSLKKFQGIEALKPFISTKDFATLTRFKRFEKINVKSRKDLGAPPVASTWLSSAAGDNPTAAPKKTNFIFDCNYFAKDNNKIRRAQHPDDKSSLRIATYNVHSWKNPFDKYAQQDEPSPYGTIFKIDADILILQEVEFWKDYRENDRKIFKSTPYGFDYFGDTNNPTDDKQEFGNLILSRFPFEEEPVVTYFTANANDAVKRCFINAKIKLANDKILSIYGTHLDVFDNTEATRLAQIKQITEAAKLDESDYIIIAGDFNSVRKQDYANIPGLWDWIVRDNLTRNSPTPTLVFDHLQQEGFIDCFAAQGKPSPTFTSWAGTRIDFIMIKTNQKQSPPALYYDAAVYYDAASDHCPVLLDIAVINKNNFINKRDNQSHTALDLANLYPEIQTLLNKAVT